MSSISQAEVDRVRLENAINNLGPQIRSPGQTGQPILVLVVDEVVRLRAELKRKKEHAELCTQAIRIAHMAINHQLNKTTWEKIEELLP